MFPLRRRNAVLACLSSATVLASTIGIAVGDEATTAKQEREVVELLKAIETGTSASSAVINPAQYPQHNLGVADGLAGFGALLAESPKGTAKVNNTVRVFGDGGYVFAHTEYNFFGPKIGFDIFRFETGRIVEHWGSLQESAEPNAGKHTMIDGATEVGELENAESDKRLVKSFVEDILVHGRMEKLAGY